MLHFGDSVYEAELRGDVLAGARESHVRLEAAVQTSARRSVLSERGRRLLARLGDLLVDLGCELKTRYAVGSQRF